jgi:hypothetical protein
MLDKLWRYMDTAQRGDEFGELKIVPNSQYFILSKFQDA